MEELLELELAGWTALCDGTASEFYGSVMAEHGVMVLAHGEVMDRASVVEALRETRSWVSYEIDDTRFVDLGADAAALLYTGTGYRADGSSFVALMSSVYTRSRDGWKLTLYQQTPKP